LSQSQRRAAVNALKLEIQFSKGQAIVDPARKLNILQVKECRAAT